MLSSKGLKTLLLTRQQTHNHFVYFEFKTKKNLIESANHFRIMEMVEKWPVKRFYKRMVLNGNNNKKNEVSKLRQQFFSLRFNRDRTQIQCKKKQNVLRHSASGGFDARSLTAILVSFCVLAIYIQQLGIRNE